MSIVKIWLVFMVGIEAGAEQIRPVDVESGPNCGCKCKTDGPTQSLSKKMAEILQKMQQKNQQEVVFLRPKH